MPHFKDQSGKIYHLDAGADPKKWLPADCAEIPDDEAMTLAADIAAKAEADIAGTQ